MTHQKVYLRNFSALWDKKFWTENHDPPPLIHIFFRYRNFSWTQHRRVPLQSFSVLRDKRISTENFDTPPFLSINLFVTGNFLKHSTKGFPCKVFRHCETKKFRRKILILPLLIHKLIRNWKLSETQHKRVPLRIFSALWDKKLPKENLDTSPSLLSIIFFATRNFLKHSTEGFPCKVFRHRETKKIRRKILILLPFLSILFFRYRNISWTQHRRIPLWSYSVLRDKSFPMENHDITLWSIKFFDTRN